MYKEVLQEEDRIGKEVVNAAFHVHKEPGDYFVPWCPGGK
jgi:hypothetical protein